MQGLCNAWEHLLNITDWLSGYFTQPLKQAPLGLIRWAKHADTPELRSRMHRLINATMKIIHKVDEAEEEEDEEEEVNEEENEEDEEEEDEEEDEENEEEEEEEKNQSKRGRGRRTRIMKLVGQLRMCRIE